MARFTIDDVKKYVNALLGGNGISVELVTEDWIEIIGSALTKYNECRPKIIKSTMAYTVDKQEYVLHPKNVGRGVFNVEMPESSYTQSIINIAPGLSYNVNTNEWQNTSALNALLLNKSFTEVVKHVVGEDDIWDYNRDSYTLTIKPPKNAAGLMILHCMFDKYFGEYKLSCNSGVVNTNVQDSTGNVLYNINPFDFVIVATKKNKDKVYVRGNETGVLTGGATGNVDFKTGAVMVNFTDPSTIDDDKVYFVVNELRTSDELWFKDYCYSLACIIVGNKRSRFSSIPGSQSPIVLDTAKLQQGIDQKKDLDEKAQSWIWEWLIPREL